MNIWRFIIFWRYLLLACLVLVAAGEYLRFGLAKSIAPGVPQRSSLRGKHEKIEQWMTEAQVMEILGTPQSRIEEANLDMKIMKWAEGQDEIVIIFLWTDKARVYQKRFFTGPRKFEAEPATTTDGRRDAGLAELIVAQPPGLRVVVR
jgi:hypothetical protein